MYYNGRQESEQIKMLLIVDMIPLRVTIFPSDDSSNRNLSELTSHIKPRLS